MRGRWIAFVRIGLLTLASLTSLGLPATASAGEPIELASGTVKKLYGQLIAGEAGAVYSMPGGMQVKAAPGTEFRVFSSVQHLLLSAGEQTRGYSVLVRQGRLDIFVPEKQPSRTLSAVMVSAPKKMSAIVTSGHATVFASDSQSVVVNRVGVTLTGAGSGWAALAAGSLRARDARSPLGELEKSPSAPAEIRGPTLRTAFEGEVSLGDLTWSTVEGAKAYEVVVVDQAKRAELVRFQTSQTRLDPAPNLGPGAYEVRVKAIDARGTDSTETRVSTVRVLGAELPTGSSFGSDGTIYLGARGQLRLSHVAGLKMTYGRADYYIDAPSSVGLYRNEPTSVTFKDPKTNQTLRLSLVPSAQSAEIKLTPRSVVWPRDKVDIQVKIKDPRGAQASADARPLIQLRLGLTPLKASWKRHGNVWRTTIPPQAGPGPWVLRISVSDEQGAALGHDFLEIAPAASAKSEPVARR